MKKFLRRVKSIVNGRYIKVKTSKVSKEWIGNDYGGFYLNTNLISKSSVVYSIGIGTDVSFDKELINRFNCKVYAYDPTPKSIKWVDKNFKNKNFIFFPIGLSEVKGIKDFYLPKNNSHVSGSFIKIDSVDRNEIVKLKFDTLLNQLSKNNHYKIDVLKMDIEGAEYEVINHIYNNKINIKQVCVEFHPHLIEDGKNKTKNAIGQLQKLGYNCFGISDSLLEYSFIK